VLPTHLSREVLQLHDGNSRVAGQAFDEERFPPRADRSAEEVAHRHGLRVAGAPERHVLAQRGLERVLRVDVVERARRLDETR